jgi:hypothetical protein
MAKKRKPNQKVLRWIDAPKRYHLSHLSESSGRYP